MESSFVLFGMFASLMLLMLSGAGLAFVLGAIAFLATATLWKFKRADRHRVEHV